MRVKLAPQLGNLLAQTFKFRIGIFGAGQKLQVVNLFFQLL